MHLNPIGRSAAGRARIGHVTSALATLLLLALASWAPGPLVAAGAGTPPGIMAVVWGPMASPTGAAAPMAPPTDAAARRVTSPQDAGGSVIYLVRHAETAGDRAMDPSDPPLSEAGEARAAALADALADAGLTSILSTDLQRTRATAAPVAAATGLEVQMYDPSDQPAMRALLERLGSDGGRHLIVGHSNTTPALVRMLGGDPMSPISESEYDRLYVVSVTAGGEVISTLLRYGRPSVPADAGARGGGHSHRHTGALTDAAWTPAGGPAVRIVEEAGASE